MQKEFAPYFWLKNKHIQTVLPYFLGRFLYPKYALEKVEANQNEWLVCNTIFNKNPQIAFIVHGLEGSANSHYIKRIAIELSKKNIDVCAINLRGCGGHANLNFADYHSGKTDDLDIIINHFLSKNLHKSASIIGYSLGANLALKYVGEKSHALHPKIVKCVAISAPFYLADSANCLDKKENDFYKKRFLKSLISKVLAKKNKYPFFDYTKAANITSIRDFDTWYTAPTFGYANAQEYYTKNSADQFLETIKIETLIIASKDDPFLDVGCFVIPENPKVKTLYTSNGGHVGFLHRFGSSFFWLDAQILNFLK